MALAFYITNAVALTALDAITATIGTSGKLKIYDDTGTVPADADDGIGTNVLLVTLPLTADAFADAADDTPGALSTANALTTTAAIATGTAAFYRVTTSADVVVMQGTVGTATSDLVLNSVAIASGIDVAVSAWTIRLPEIIGG